MQQVPNLGMILPNMGRKPVKQRRTKPVASGRVSLADALFTNTQQRVLARLFGQPGRSFYASELIALAEAGSGAVQRELARLAQSGLLTVKPVGNQKHYQANRAAPIFTELCGIVQKTVGLAEPLRAALEPLARQIEVAFVYGSVAKREDTASSDIDLMIVSDALSFADTFEALEHASARLGRAVNPNILSRKELASGLKEGDAFLKRVLAQPKIWLIGGDDDLRI